MYCYKARYYEKIKKCIFGGKGQNYMWAIIRMKLPRKSEKKSIFKFLGQIQSKILFDFEKKLSCYIWASNFLEYKTAKVLCSFLSRTSSTEVCSHMYQHHNIRGGKWKTIL